MTKKELVAYVAEKANLSKKDAEIAVNSVFDGITEALKTDGKIQLVGFGSFEVKERAARMGKNPATGERSRSRPAKPLPLRRERRSRTRSSKNKIQHQRGRLEKSGRLFLCKLQEVIMKKMKTGIGVMLALLCCILMCTGVVYATGDDTDGTELQVAQPVILEVQLGPQWAGVEFQLKTDVGLYPGTIAVGQDGILRTELGNSGSYVLSCLTLNAAVPSPGDIPSPDVTQQEQEPLTTDSAENADAASQNVQEQDSGRPTVGGIPVMHIILFGGGLLLASGALVAMRFIRNRRPSERSPYDEDDDEDDYEY